jgi:NADH-quinone oxidoreductase subunit L
MVAGTLALTGFPFTAGYYSKDAIIEAAFASHSDIGMYAFILSVAAALLTSFYSWRLIFMTFHGRPRGEPEVHNHAHESPMVMLVPLFLLALGSLAAGFAFKELFIGHGQSEFWRGALFMLPSNQILDAMHHVPPYVILLPFAMMATGFFFAWLFYIYAPVMPANLAKAFPGIYAFLLNKWYFDELYDALFTQQALRIGRALWKTGDGRIIDGIGPDGVAARVLDVTGRVVRLQSGYIYHYAFAMLIGVALLATWFIFAGGGVL